jgi:hypothetical protein
MLLHHDACLQSAPLEATSSDQDVQTIHAQGDGSVFADICNRCEADFCASLQFGGFWQTLVNLDAAEKT